jgi:hypothetical protein
MEDFMPQFYGHIPPAPRRSPVTAASGGSAAASGDKDSEGATGYGGLRYGMSCPHCGSQLNAEDFQKTRLGDNVEKEAPGGTAKQVGEYGQDEAEREAVVHAPTSKLKASRLTELAKKL